MCNVLIFVYSLACGGAEKTAVLLGNELAGRNYDVTFVLIKKEGVLLSQLSDRIRVEQMNPLLVRFKLIGMITAFWVFLRKNSFDTIMAKGEWPNTIAPITVKLTRMKSRVYIVEESVKTFVNHPAVHDAGKMVSLCARMAYRLADGIISVSESIKEELIKTLPRLAKSITVINNPCPVKDILLKSKEPVSHPWIVHKREPVIIAVGRLHASKDYPTMIKAFAEANRKRPMKLLILGDGPLLDGLKLLCEKSGVAERAEFLGFQENPYKYIAGSDVFVHSAEYEGFPLVFVEAMACGKRIVTTACGIPEELLKTGLFKLVVPTGDYAALANAILAGLNSKMEAGFSVRKSMNFDIGTVTGKYLTALGI